ncbi:MAG TPA: RimK/LysX family protein [Gemmataceae bacterium]|nr:RimK/LysX family protein [Gemmataceae bacterium]
MADRPDPSPEPLPVGWKEHVAFPEWGVRRVRAKVDTGARTSALGVGGYELWEDAGRGTMVRLRLALSRKHPERQKVVEAPVLRTVVVRNSAGVPERRPVIEALARLGPVEKRILLTLTYRPAMRFRLILGRQALAGDFIVDVSKKYLLKT